MSGLFAIVDAVEYQQQQQQPATTRERGDSIAPEYTQPVEAQAQLLAAASNAEIRAAYVSWQQKLLAGTARDARERQLETFIDLLKAALAKRERRLQAQMPLDGRSILAFLTPRVNERLINLLFHPTAGHPNAVGSRWTPAQYAGLPLVINNFNLAALNRLLGAVHEAYHGRRPGVVDAWVEQHRDVLRRFAHWLGLDASFQPTVVVQPHVPSGSIVVWDSYHATKGAYVDAAGRVQTTNDFYGTVFLDYCPRRLFSERVWNIVYQCHSVSIVDIGAGSATYRDSKYTFAYSRATGVDTSVGALVRPELLHYFGAPRLEPLATRTVSTLPTARGADIERAFRDGHAVLQVPDLASSYQQTWAEFRDYLQWIMLDSEPDFARNARGQVVVPYDRVPAQIRLTGTLMPADRDLLHAVLGGNIGARKAADVLGFGGSNAFWRRRRDGQRGAGAQSLSKISIASGMGIGTSFYGGASHLLLQCLVAPTFEALYGEPVVVVPERFRIKLNTSWESWHIDHAPLPAVVEAALAAESSLPADADDDTMTE